jgi:hypothetical protein
MGLEPRLGEEAIKRRTPPFLARSFGVRPDTSGDHKPWRRDRWKEGCTDRKVSA